MKRTLRNGVIVTLLALVAAPVLAGCVVAPGYHHRGYGYHDGYRHGHHGHWR